MKLAKLLHTKRVKRRVSMRDAELDDAAALLARIIAGSPMTNASLAAVVAAIDDVRIVCRNNGW